jgi:hypothetical protein
MLEKIPGSLGQALLNQRAGMEQVVLVLQRAIGVGCLIGPYERSSSKRAEIEDARQTGPVSTA